MISHQSLKFWGELTTFYYDQSGFINSNESSDEVLKLSVTVSFYICHNLCLQEASALEIRRAKNVAQNKAMMKQLNLAPSVKEVHIHIHFYSVITVCVSIYILFLSHLSVISPP